MKMNHESDQAGISNQHDPELRRVSGFLIRVEGLGMRSLRKVGSRAQQGRGKGNGWVR